MTATFYMVIIGIICFSIGFTVGTAMARITGEGGYDDDHIAR